MNMTITDDTELSEQMAHRARAALALADVIGGDAIDRAAALVTAAAVTIEREVGPRAAADALALLVNPQLAAWRGAAH